MSHDRAFLDGCVDHILALNKTGVSVQSGTFSTWWENKSRQDAYEQAQNDKLKGEMKRLAQAAKRTSTWSDRVEATKTGSRNSGLRPDRGYIGHRSAKMMQRAKSIDTRRQSAGGGLRPAAGFGAGRFSQAAALDRQRPTVGPAGGRSPTMADGQCAAP